MYNGIINVYKERGYTSHDVVAKLRGILGQKKIGHTGTLDPDAEGVLPVCLGSGTKLCDMLTNRDKVYEAGLLLGITTDTLDITGTVTGQADWEEFVRELKISELEERIYGILSSFVGRQMQVPPMYSALKVNGKKLVDLARTGVVLERKPREIEIYSIEVLSMDLPHIRLLVHCGKGTYIRSLCDDIGRALGCGGCMESLIRRAVGPFRLEDAKTLGEITELRDRGELEQYITPPDEMFDYPSVRVDASFLVPARNGNPIPTEKLEPEYRDEAQKPEPEYGDEMRKPEPEHGDEVQKSSRFSDNMRQGSKKDLTKNEFLRIYLPDGKFLGIYRRNREKDSYLPEKIFYSPEKV
ncbi:MAG: tRNA pseudouridine(55) synthase TruB [Lachnospiraceae bacterium]|nr:tRNA pseudouridine(55) synthase TruB [Lachnospiraceae bacterium]